MLFFAIQAALYHIEIRGNKRIEKEAIKSYIPSHEKLDQEDLNNLLKILYETGYFKDVKVDLKDKNLIITVVEQPIINKIVFEGNKRLGSDIFQKELGLSTGQSFSDFKVIDEAGQKIKAIYRSIGYLNTKVLVQSRPVSEGRIDVVFQIQEGQQAVIRSIQFIGNKAFSSQRLRREIESKVYSGFKFWSQFHYFSADRLQQDLMKLQEFYLNNGYPDAQITSSSSELRRDQKGFDLIFSVKEGSYCTFGNITIESQLPQKVDLNHLKNIITIKKGKTFAKGVFEEAEEIIIHELNKQNISTAEVEITPKREGNVFDIKILIKKGSINKIRHINIRGNRRTYSKVIRDNLEISEGDFLNSYRLKQSEYNLYGLGFFEKIQVAPKPIGHGMYDLDILVEESPKTGTTSFQAGWGSYEGFLLQIQYVERNIGGTGNAVNGVISIAMERQEASFGIGIPRFLDLPNVQGNFGFSFERSTLVAEDRQSIDFELNLNMAYQLNRYVSQRVGCDAGFEYLSSKGGRWSQNLEGMLRGQKKDLRFGLYKFSYHNPKEGQYAIDPDKNIFPGLKAGEMPDHEVIVPEGQTPLKYYEPILKEHITDEHKTIEILNKLPDMKEEGKKSDKQKTNLFVNHERVYPHRENSPMIKKKDMNENITPNDLIYIANSMILDDLRNKLWNKDVGLQWFVRFSHILEWSPFLYNPNRKFSFKMHMHNVVSLLDIKYHKHSLEFNYRYWMPALNQSIIKVWGNAGIIEKIGDDMRMHDGMILSGVKVKGFARSGISPRDSWTQTYSLKNGKREVDHPGEAIYGTKYYHGGIELKIPLFDPRDFGINVGGYFNFGNVWDSKWKNTKKHPNRFWDEDYLRTSVGCFVALRFPQIPLRFDYAIALRHKEDVDVLERFHVGIDM